MRLFFHPLALFLIIRGEFKPSLFFAFIFRRFECLLNLFLLCGFDRLRFDDCIDPRPVRLGGGLLSRIVPPLPVPVDHI